jgi:hypothetical protein
VSRENLPWLVMAVLLLIGGWFASQRVLVSFPADQETIETFREWLWGTRSMDLAVQVGIIFVGALGIAALLPRGDEIPRGDELPRGDEPAHDDEAFLSRNEPRATRWTE